MKTENLIQSSRGKKDADVLFMNVRIVNVFSGRIISTPFAVSDGFVIGFGQYPAKRVIDLENRFAAPGFIDSHVHIESSMTSIGEFARTVIPHGTTTVIADPHEIANVMGADGIRFMLESAENELLNVYFTMPSCVPATHLETSGATLDAPAITPFMTNKRIVGLAELMNYPGVLNCNDSVLHKLSSAISYGKPVDGHAPGLSGKDLYAYISAGVSSDHECTTAEEALEKLEAGMVIMIRESTGAKNLLELVPVINTFTSTRMMWCTDDLHPHDLIDKGHIAGIVRQAIRNGVDPITAIRMATLTPSDYFRLHHLGAISPGRLADFIVFSDITDPVPEQVYCRGRLAAENSAIALRYEKQPTVSIRSSMNLKTDSIDLSIPATSSDIRVIGIIPNQIMTKSLREKPLISNHFAISDPARDILKIVVIERHQKTGNIGKGFVKGFGFQKGAVASSVAHDSHNLIAVGVDDKDILTAINGVAQMKGGMAVSCNGILEASLPLPIAGLMSPESASTVRNLLDQLLLSAKKLGTSLPDPFMTLSFLALPVIPELKITDKGLVENFSIVPLFLE